MKLFWQEVIQQRDIFLESIKALQRNFVSHEALSEKYGRDIAMSYQKIPYRRQEVLLSGEVLLVEVERRWSGTYWSFKSSTRVQYVKRNLPWGRRYRRCWIMCFVSGKAYSIFFPTFIPTNNAKLCTCQSTVASVFMLGVIANFSHTVSICFVICWPIIFDSHWQVKYRKI